MIRFANNQDTPAVRRLFDQCFPDESGFNSYYFTQHYCPERTLLFQQGDNLCAMLQMLPYQLSIGDKTGEATYIYGACTHPEYRRRHLMAQLLETSFQLDLQYGRIASLLIPQEEWLFDFYRPFGYLPLFTLERRSILQAVLARSELRPLTKWCEVNLLYTKKTEGEPCRILRREADWRAQLALFNHLGSGAFGLYEKDELVAYAFVWLDPDGLFAQELLGVDLARETLLAQQLLHHFSVKKLVYHTVSGSQVLGCLKPYQKNMPTHGYINLMFN